MSGEVVIRRANIKEMTKFVLDVLGEPVLRFNLFWH